jgi:hypothetical protein
VRAEPFNIEIREAKMRKALWIMLAVVSLAIAAPIAQADATPVPVPSIQADPLFTYSYSDPAFGYSWTTTALSAATIGTIIPAADLTAASTSGVSAGCTIVAVILDNGGAGLTSTEFGNGCFAAVNEPDNFALTDYSTPGTYVSAAGDTLVVTAAPEPSSVALMLFGAGMLLFLTRKPGKKVGHPLSA